MLHGKKNLKLVALHDHGQMGEPFEKHVEMQDENYDQDHCFSLNSSKVQQELKWSCQAPFEEGGGAGHKVGS